MYKLQAAPLRGAARRYVRDAEEIRCIEVENPICSLKWLCHKLEILAPRDTIAGWVFR
jgi:hypothetical protein